MMHRRRLAAAAAACAMGALALASCTNETGTRDSSRSASKPQAAVVFAAASLSEAFPAIAADVVDGGQDAATFTFDGSSGLLDQLKAGARADVYATADTANMEAAKEAGLVDDYESYASNRLVLGVPKGNPAGITGLDSSLDGKKLVICAQGVPCGNATRKLAERLKVSLKPVSEEQKVTDVRGKVASGEADAGLMYATDAAAERDAIDVVEVDGIDDDINAYEIAVLKDAPHPEAARAFVKAVMSESGQKILRDHGFGPPRDADSR
ncbi:MAG: molybdate ABC transporter substrate-binding protein [Actinomycetaceae bacterium]|nr:molybdate ABC transporter substrate-binding protein [Actinomycetaceae bacterium]